MAEELSNGRIRISINEENVPILVTEGNIIQTPIFNNSPHARIKLSKHGDKSLTWMVLSQDVIFSVQPPFYVMCNLTCDIPLMKL